MRKIYLFIPALLSLLMVSSCSDTEPGIDMIYTQFSRIQSGDNHLQNHCYENVVAVNWDQFLGDIAEDEVLEIRPSFVTVSNNQGLPLDFVEHAYMNILLGDDPNSPLEMAFRENLPLNTGISFELIPGLADFKNELTDGTFTFRLCLNYYQPAPYTVDPLQVDFGFQAYLK